MCCLKKQGQVNLSKSVICVIAELAERSPIIIQNSSNPSSQKNLDVRPYDRTIIQGATLDMRGQMYHTNAMALSSSPVVSALAGARHCALETCRKKKMRALLLGLAKSTYYS